MKLFLKLLTTLNIGETNMKTVEERLKAEQFKNKLLLELLEAQLGPEAVARLKVTMEALDVVSDHDPKYFEDFIERLES